MTDTAPPPALDSASEQALWREFWDARNSIFQLLAQPGPCDGEAFFNRLIDYLSFGHFEWYQRIHPDTSDADIPFEKLHALTQAILDQHDQYQIWKKKEREIISEAACLLAERCDVEDAWLAQGQPHRPSVHQHGNTDSALFQPVTIPADS